MGCRKMSGGWKMPGREELPNQACFVRIGMDMETDMETDMDVGMGMGMRMDVEMGMDVGMGEGMGMGISHFPRCLMTGGTGT